MRYSTGILKGALFCGLISALSACDNSPQAPSDVVDDKAAESPYVDDEIEEEDPSSTDFAVSDNSSDRLGTGEADPTTTGAVSIDVTDLSSITGQWAAFPADCAGGGTLVTITDTTIERVGMVCEFADTIDAGGGSIAATLSCPISGGTGTDSELVKLTPRGDTLDLNFVGTAQPPETLSRCP